MLTPDLEKRTPSAAAATDKLQELMATISQVGIVAPQLQKRIEAEGATSVEEAPEAVSSTPTMAPAAKSEVQHFVQVSYQGNWEEKLYPLSDSPTIVGRAPSSDIPLNQPGQRYVSKRHCEILVRNKRVLIRDLGSTNGTILGTDPLQSNAFREWKPDMEVFLGPFTLALKSSRDLQSVPSPPSAKASMAGSGITVTQVHSSIKVVCPNAVPSRLPLSHQHPVIIGRALDSDMVLDHPHVSKHHCRIQVGSDGIEVVDLRSTNGTYIGQQRLPPHQPVAWRDEPSVRIGPFNITLEEPSAGGG
jgi:pSer/pThr/pTyr-binding forkhead associated (FHA) protein